MGARLIAGSPGRSAARRRPRLKLKARLGYANPDDLFKSIDRIILSAASAGEEYVKLETGIARYILERAKRAPKEDRGRKVISRDAKQAENLILSQALLLKAELAAKGMAKEEAAEEAAKEASDAFLKQGRPLALSTIKRLMQGRRKIP
jgi:hypothetical protein